MTGGPTLDSADTEHFQHHGRCYWTGWPRHWPTTNEGWWKVSATIHSLWFVFIKTASSCPSLLISREMQIKTTVRHHLTPIRTAFIKKSTNNRRWRGYGEKRTLLHCRWEYKLVQPLWRTVRRFLKKIKIELP